MKTLGNLIWVIFGGLIWAILLFLAGIFYCCTIIGIPVGLKLFQLAGFVIWPFGKTVSNSNVTGFKTFLNIIWLIFGGLEMAFGFCVTGLIFCITIIGIPFGRQYFKIAGFVLLPLGRSFVK